MSASPPAPAGESEPSPDCPLCPRLDAFRQRNRALFPDFHNAPVASFGERHGRLLVVGLAPGVKGANRTGRPFTGDFAGTLLYETLHRHGFANGAFQARPDDGLALIDCRVTNAVRCVPPENKPIPAEIATCNQFLRAEMAALPHLTAVLALGRIAHDAVLAALGLRRAAYPFAHGAVHQAGGLTLFDSYHCSRYNTQTRRLTEAMFHSVVASIRERLSA